MKLKREGCLVVKGTEDPESVLSNYDFIERRILRCPHTETALKMMLLIQEVKEKKDSIGGMYYNLLSIIWKGIISTVCSNVPVGLGEPCFDKVRDLLIYMCSF